MTIRIESNGNLIPFPISKKLLLQRVSYIIQGDPYKFRNYFSDLTFVYLYFITVVYYYEAGRIVTNNQQITSLDQYNKWEKLFQLEQQRSMLVAKDNI